MSIATLNDIDIYYEVHGSGPALLLLNGSGGTIAAAGPMIQKLAAHFEVVIHDQRGLGRTMVPPDTPTMADYSADVAALLDHVGRPTVMVFGISFGGMVAQEFAATFPHRVERMALLCTSSGGAGGSSYPLHKMASMSPNELARVRLHLADRRYTPEFLAAHPFDQRLVDAGIAGRAAPRTEEQLRGESMQLVARSHHDVWDRLGNITCPTLVAFGQFDAMAPPANSEAIASRIAGSELRGYQGGHGFVWQDRQAWPDIVSFLSSSASLHT